ncbi:type II toxin-antitoxin system prevent-host-death family antitoxin [Streptosporangium sp. NPDC049248]|uniref:type II toxin-antitoxin system Phd/YefM family antitoxin n=1 Tax=Streptosporangium sp. NPDC049248 TaxID=3155651 RepID=UPI0034181F1A
MKTVTQREFRNNSAAVMDAVEAGEIYHITRNGIEVAELRPLARRRRLTAEELVARHRRPPRVDYEHMRQEADKFFDAYDNSAEHTENTVIASPTFRPTTPAENQVRTTGAVGCDRGHGDRVG